MVDTRDLKSRGFGREGSIPSRGTTKKSFIRHKEGPSVPLGTVRQA